MNRILLTILWTLLAICVSAHDYTFRRIDTTNGLPDNEVKKVFRMPDGRMGVRTSSQLSLYDGQDFKTIQSPAASSKGYPTRYVSPLPTAYTDENHNVWFKEQGNISVLDCRREALRTDVRQLLAQKGIHEPVDNFFIDNRHGFWAVTRSGRLRYAAARQQAITVALSVNGLRDVCRRGDEVWMVYADGRVVGWRLTDRRMFYRQRLWSHQVVMRDFVKFGYDGRDLWLIWDSGVAHYQPATRQWRQTLRATGKHSMTDLTPVGNGRALVAVRHGGLWLTDSRQPQANRLIPLVTGTGDTLDDDINTLEYDRGNLFVGLYSSGLCYYNATANLRKFPFVSTVGQGMSNAYGYRLCALPDGNICITGADGIWKYQTATRQFGKTLTQLAGKDYLQMYRDHRDRLWIGSFRGGLYVVDPDGSTHHYLQGENPLEDVNFNIARCFAEDRQGRVWIGFQGGIGAFDEHRHTIIPLFLRHPELRPYKMVNSMACDGQGRLWVASSTGLYVYRPDLDRVQPLAELVADPEMLELLNAPCKTVQADRQGRIWIGTFTGLYVYQASTRSVVRWTTAEGMPSNVVQSVVQDSQGCVWVATANGLCRFSPVSVPKAKVGTQNLRLDVFDVHNALTDSHFLPDCAAASGGRVYLGCADGFYLIDPTTISPTRYEGHPLLTSLFLYDKEVKPGMNFKGREILASSLATTRKVVLRYDENFITLRFSGLNYKAPLHTYYRYRLRGLDSRWVETRGQGGQGVATYTALPPGEYTFEVYTAGLDKRWGRPATLVIEVEAPLWATWWARLFYLLVVVGAVILVYRHRMERNRQRMELEKLQEVEEMKYRFFTNISHEFRTLLTLIITPLRAVIRDSKDETARQRLQAVDRNAGDLLQLVNQLLDFRRMEMGGEKLLLHSGCINEFVEYTVSKFSPLALQRQVELHFENQTDTLLMYFDNDKVGKILTNLLSNAFKFTPPEGQVTVTLDRTVCDSRPAVSILVADTGCGISEADLKHIFDRFYRAEDQSQTRVGSGIGLNIVRDYVQLHQGHIQVESHIGQGTCFTVVLPADLKPAQEMAAAQTGPQATPASDFTGKTILLVEDNQEFRTFLAAELSNRYKVLEADDGQNGLLIASSQNPDIVVSDVMMPRMNGTEMCRRLKADLHTSHIPVILLTAWDSDKGRTQAYQVGADGYLQKPFDLDTLQARIDNLLAKRDERVSLFSHSATLDAKAVASTQPDEDFVNRVIGCVERHISDSDYGIEQLARDVLMSRMSLYRKIRSLTGQTPADFIRTVRLKYAAQLLRQGRLSVQEVGYQTGFSSPQNFAKRFKDMFGMLPSQYKTQ